MQKNKCGRASHPTALFVELLRSPSAARRRRSSAAASGPFLLNEQGWGRRPQRPGTSTRFRAFLECPPAIHPRESPAAAASTASSGELTNSHVFDEPTLGEFVAYRNSKCRQACAEAVDVAISLWKAKENLE